MKVILSDHQDLKFRFTDNISAGKSFSISAKILEVVQSAILIIWNNRIGKPHEFNIVFQHEFSGYEKALSAYYPLRDIYAFALTRMREVNILKHGFLFLLAAHEAFHNFQCLQGDPPPDFHENLDYFKCPYERKAWIESLDAFKAYHPAAAGMISLNGKDYFQVPEKSSYYL